MTIRYGNGTKISYTYDPETYRLRRLLTVNLNNNEILQDLHYWYDPVGNITEIQDDAQQTIFFNNSVVSPRQQFTYDAIYRLIQAQGRELIGTATFGAEDNWNDAAWQTAQKGDGNVVQNYTQLYTYDAVGNLLELQHIATAGSYTRTYEIASDNNQLLNTTVGADTYTYQHEARGNMAAMPHLDAMYWNLNNELNQIENGTMLAYYQYSGGQRIRKYVYKGNVTEERIYLGSFEIYRKFENSSLIIERTTVHVSDDTGRIAMQEKRTEGNAGDDHGTAEELTRYIYSNHLQSASLELDETGEVISYEEYHPYGTTSYQAMNASINAVAKRYRYTGKERDEESGLYYHGARYYIPWLCRWSAVDPLESDYSPWSPYHYVKCNPINDTDSTGMGGDKDIEKPPIPSKPTNGVVANINTTSTNSTHTQSYNAVDVYYSNRKPTQEEFAQFQRDKLPQGGTSHPLSTLIDVGTFRGDLNEITAMNGYRWEIKPIIMEEKNTMQVVGTTMLVFEERSRWLESIETNATYTLTKEKSMKYEISFYKDGTSVPELTTQASRFWKTDKPEVNTIQGNTHIPSLIKPSIDFAVGMRLNKQHFDMNTVTQAGQYLESLSLITDASKGLGIGNDIAGLANISTGYFGIIKTAVDGLFLDQITKHYQDLDKDNQRQVTNPGEYIKWQLKENKVLNKGLFETKK